ncbi:MAG: hypothetical protein P9L91_01165 [Candidatus Zophobacter franzmannii]|nr:hypothetical protein [Candidatus Zophobacter franzmannii]
MRKASNRLVTLLLLSLVVSFLFYGCGVEGDRDPNKLPTISITSYEGVDADVQNEFITGDSIVWSRQKLYWHAVDTDGTVENYAYRLLNEEGTPIPSPGNEVIDIENAVVPSEVNNKYGGGWVLHFREGSLQETSLAEAPNDRKTIWTNQKYVELNLPAADTLGNAAERVSTLEVICIDNRGGVSNLASRKFKAQSEVPDCLLRLSKGALEDPIPFDARELSKVGTGIILSFSIVDSDPFVESEADYYNFKVFKRDASTREVIEQYPADDTWFNTRDHGNTESISEFLLTKYTTPAISNDFDNSLQLSYTEVVARAVDMAGIQSEYRTIRFAVREGYHPATIFYPERNYALGDKHFTDYRYAELEEDPPQVEGRYATAMFKNADGFYACLGSRNLKIWLRWGFHGQYGYKNEATSQSIVTDNPYDSALNILLDEETDENYFSQILFYDLRLDGAPYNYPPLADEVITDETGDYVGESWLRVPVANSIAQSIVVSGLESGFHIFEVRGVDLQGEVDKTPARFEFVVEEPVSAADKSGVLIIDDDHPTAQFLSPEAFTDDFYNSLFANLTSTDELDMLAIENNLDNIGRRVSPTDLEKYKLVVYHSDSPASENGLVRENDALSLYMYGGGNLIISGGSNIDAAIRNSFTEEKTFFHRFLDMFDTVDYPIDLFTQSVTNNAAANPFFIKAHIEDAYSANGAGVVNLETDADIAFSTYVDNFAGMGPITYFPELPWSFQVPIAKYGCKSVYDDNRPPLPDQYEQFNMQNVGIKVTTRGSVYVFGFPLSYMESSVLVDETDPSLGTQIDTSKPVFKLIENIYQEIISVPAE